MTREEIEQALFTLSGHDPKFREVGLTADLWKHIERLEQALREIAGNTCECGSENIAHRALAAQKGETR